MRADNNWEDKVGKRLFDLEGELSPQAWENISRQIAPKPKANRRWLWLPLLLVFLSLPLAFFYRNDLKDQFRLATLSGQQEQAKTEATVRTEPGLLAGKTNGQTLQNELATIEQTGSSERMPEPQRTADIKSPAQTPGHPDPAFKTKPAREITLPGMIAEIEPEPAKDKRPAEKTNRKNPVTKTLVPVTATAKNRPKTVGKTAEKPVAGETGIVTATRAGQPADPEEKGRHKAAETGASETRTTTLANSTKWAGNAVSGSAGKVPAIANPKEEKSPETAASQALVSEEIKSETATPALSDSAAGKAVLAEKLVIETDTAVFARNREEKPEKAAAKNWAYGIYGAPQYTFQRVLANVNDEIMILRLNNQNTLETERLGYEFGFRGYYPLREKLQLEVGFHFARLNQYLNFTTASQLADSLVVKNQNGQVSMEIRNRERTEILLFKYFFGGLYAGGKMQVAKNWHLTAGLGTNWMLWKNPDEEIIPVATKSFNPYLSAGLRYHFALSSKLTLQAGPTLQYYVRSLQKESAFYQAKPTTFGFRIGVLFHQKK